MSSLEGRPEVQNVGNVSATSSQVVAGYVGGNVYFATDGTNENPKDVKVRGYQDALFLTDPEIDKASIISAKGKRVSGTCEWILEDDDFISFLTGDCHLLSIAGGPGKGKTILSVFLIDEIRQRKVDGHTMFYFCSNDDERRNSAESILRGLLWQMIRVLPKDVRIPELDSPTMVKASINSRESLWSVLVKLCKSYTGSTLFCVIDGLDECVDDTAHWLITKLCDLLLPDGQRKSSSHLRVAVVSRRVDGLEKIPVVLNLDPDYNGPISLDVQHFIAKRVHELMIKFCKTDDGLVDDIKGKLEERADGTFLWVGFAMDQMLRKKTLSDAMVTLDSLPRGLPGIYARILLQIEPKYRHITSYIFQWLALAARPLRTEELLQLIALQLQVPLNSIPADYLVHCGSFVEVRNERIELIHQSARDYLLRTDPDSDPVLESFRIQFQKANHDICRRCLDVMMMWNENYSSDFRTKLRSDCLVGYAVVHWPSHARFASAEARALLSHPCGMFDEKSYFFDEWWQQYSDRENRVIPREPLLMASLFGISPWVEKLIATRRGRELWTLRKPVNRQVGFWGDTALHYAVDGRHADLVSLLLQRGADISIGGYMGRTALHNAVLGGRYGILRSMIGHRSCRVNSGDSLGKTALHFAAGSGTTDAMSLLMQHKADVNAVANDGRSVLHAAAETGLASKVELLLKAGAGPNIATEYPDGPVLKVACASGSLEVATLLLGAGAHVNATGGNFDTAIRAAAHAGDAEMIRTLLDAGADANAAIRFWKTRGAQRVVGLLEQATS